MSTIALPLYPSPNDELLHAGFVAILPRIERHARISFRDIRCPNKKEDLVAETIALSWAWYARLVRKGKDVAKFVSALARFAARAVRSGRKVAGKEKAKDALSQAAQRRHGFTVEPLPASTRTSFEKLYSAVHGQQETDTYEERLRDNTVTPPPEAAAFRIDFPQFLQALSERNRELAQFLSLGHSAKEAARRFKVSQGRVTQLRQEWCRQWHTLHGEEVPFARRSRSMGAA
jgi:DNA-binding NarL/FixJ family response regulator